MDFQDLEGLQEPPASKGRQDQLVQEVPLVLPAQKDQLVQLVLRVPKEIRAIQVQRGPAEPLVLLDHKVQKVTPE